MDLDENSSVGRLARAVRGAVRRGTRHHFRIGSYCTQNRSRSGQCAPAQGVGVVDLIIADLAKDGEILKAARECAQVIPDDDPDLVLLRPAPIRDPVESVRADERNWARIS